MRKNILYILISILIMGCNSVDNELVIKNINKKNPQGKDLIIDFEEVQRNSKTSIVKIKFTSGMSVPSSMFIANGMYAIAKRRNKKYFITLKDWDEGDSSFTKIGFSDSTNIDLIQTYGNDIKSDLTKDDFAATEDFDILWKY